MNVTLSHEDRLLMIAAARFRSEGNEQRSIADLLKISQPKVSRLLHEAVSSQKILAEAPAVLRKNIPEQDWQEVDERYFTHRKALVKLARHVPGHVRFDLREFGGTYDTFTQMAAVRVLELLHMSKLVGIMWGQTIANVVKGVSIRMSSSSIPLLTSIECIPLCGDPVHLMNQWEVEYSASNLAASLEIAVTGKRRSDLPCLNGVPAYVPPRLLQNREFKEFLDSIPGYHRIFKRQKNNTDNALIDMVDTIISGVGIIVTKAGSEEHETAAFIRERFQQHGPSKEELAELVLGDMGGILIEKAAANHEEIEKLNEGWIGIQEQHLKRVATATKNSTFPGIIVIAYGPEKASMVLEVVRRGYVNELIIDNKLSEKLQELAG